MNDESLGLRMDKSGVIFSSFLFSTSVDIEDSREWLAERFPEKIVPDPGYFTMVGELFSKHLTLIPVALPKNHLFLRVIDCPEPVPLALLKAIRPAWEKAERICQKREFGAPLLCLSFVEKDETVLSIMDSPGIAPLSSSLIPFNRKAIYREDPEEGGIVYRAKTDGYVLFGKKGLDLIPPPVDLDDPFSIKMKILPLCRERGKRLKYLREFLEEHARQYPAAPRSTAELTAEHLARIKGYGEIEILKGVTPVEGRDSSFELLNGPERGKEDEDRVDYRSYCPLFIAGEGQAVAKKTLAYKGRRGLTVYGEKIDVRPGKDRRIDTGENIRKEQEGETCCYYAEIIGIVRFKNNALTLDETLIIERDVDYHTGNIAYEKNIYVKGSVRSGFALECGGDLLIDGTVENGVRILCEGSVRIGEGVFGDKTVLESRGDMACSFIEQATLFCEGDLYVERSILSSKISCLGKLKVEGKNLKGKRIGVLSGSHCTVFGKLEALSLGAENNRTEIVMGGNYLAERALAEWNSKINTHRQRMVNLMDKMPFNLTTPKGREELKKLPSVRKEQVKKMLLAMKETNIIISELTEEKRKDQDRKFNPDPGLCPISFEEGVKGELHVIYDRAEAKIPKTTGSGLISYDRASEEIRLSAPPEA